MATATATPLDADLRNQVIISAVQATGPILEDGSGDKDLVGWEAEVKANARRLAVMLNDESPIAKLVSSITGAKKFVGTVEGVLKEATSTRGFIGIKSASGPGKFNKNGYEGVRTDRTDSSEEGRLLANRIAKTLIGHRVLFFVAMEKGKDDTEYRTLVHIEDLGLDSEWPNPLNDEDAYKARRAEGKENTKKIHSKDL